MKTIGGQKYSSMKYGAEKTPDQNTGAENTQNIFSILRFQQSPTTFT